MDEDFDTFDYDGDALASAGHGTDEDYGLAYDYDDFGGTIGGDSDLGGEW